MDRPLAVHPSETIAFLAGVGASAAENRAGISIEKPIRIPIIGF
jgi:hypothetical protein